MSNQRNAKSNERLVVVLCHPRTGSSLLMQTLRHLGMSVIGQRWRDTLPVEANPAGYWEDTEAFRDGFSPENLARIGTSLDRSAIKLPLRTLNKPRLAYQWDWLETTRPTLFLCTRHPLEIASSRQIFRQRGTDDMQRFILITRFLRTYSNDVQRFRSLLANRSTEFAKSIKIIDYRLPHLDPAGYLDQICRHATLSPTATQQASAIHNINPELYRHRYDDLPAQFRHWSAQLPAEQRYAELLDGF